MKIGLFPMVADVLHAGHMLAVQEAREHCDYLIVALYCTPERKNPIQSIFERYTQLDALANVDKVIPYGDKADALRMLLSLHYDIYFLGADYKNKTFEGQHLVEQLGKEIYYLSRNHTMSSTYLKDRINKRCFPEVTKDKHKVIAVDFDGCICKLDWPNIGEPNWDVINALKEEKAKGSKLILWTCRGGQLLDAAIEACTSWGIKFDAVNENVPEKLEHYEYSDSRKISADEYWDDLAIQIKQDTFNKTDKGE